jgi:TolA-binding protein
MAPFYRFLLIGFFSIFLQFSGRAQSASSIDKSTTYFNKGLQSLTLGDSLTAFQQFEQAYGFSMNDDQITYYYLMLSLHLEKPFAAQLAIKWIKQTNNVIYQSRLQYFLGEYYYQVKDAEKAILAYLKVPIQDLNNDEIIKMKFHLGYLYFKLGDWEKANNLLNSLRQIKTGLFYTDANYYAGFLALKNKEYNLALSCFEIAAKNSDYANVVPFYIGQLYYFIGDVIKAIQYCTAVLQSKDQYYDAQIRQLLGHLWFDKNEYEKALPYLATYVSKQEKVQSQDLYQLSFCYFQTKQWDKAIAGFKQLNNGSDSLAQNSMYLLATSYLKIDDKQGAKNAFLFCSTQSQNLLQKEISLFNYAKLSVELKEYAQAVVSLDQFMDTYPNSNYLLESKQLWVKALALNNNYVQALAAFESIESPNEELLKIYPTILFGRSVIYINDGQIDKAYDLLNKITTTPNNQNVISQTNFWLGELGYKLGHVDETIVALTQYLSAPINEGEITIQHAKYTLGFAYLKKGAYQEALNNFNAVSSVNPANAKQNYQQDAYVRSADCLMMLKQFKQATQAYQNVIDLHWTMEDYATLQKSIILGGLGKTNDKIYLLEQFDNQYPNSSYLNDARMELAETYIFKEDFKLAIAPLSAVVIDRKAASFYPVALYKLGVTYFNMNKNEPALENFQSLIKAYPNSVETENALEFVRNIFIEDQKPELYVSFMNDNGHPLAINEQDSLTYRSAMLRYEEKNYTDAKTGLIKYLSLFPNGNYQIESNYLVGEMNYASQIFDSAAYYFSKVADQSPNRYAERASLLAARLNYFNFKNYELAEKYYLKLKEFAVQKENVLEALRGVLRCQFKNSKWLEAAPIAKQIIDEKTFASDDILMANMVLYHEQLLKNDTAGAITVLSKIILNNSSIYTAEAHYELAHLQFLQKNYALAEKTAFEVTKKQASHEFWVTSAYILLGDIYAAQKDWFNALATYKSVTDNATITSLKEEASQKYNLAQTAEKISNKVDNQ